MKHVKQLCTVAVSLALAACGSQSTPSTPPSTPPAAPTKSAPAPAATPANAATAAPKADAPAAPSGKALVFTPAADWVVEQPSSTIRVAQYKLPKSGADSEDAELVVYHFGAMGGGTVEQNLERWASQFAQPEGGKKSSELLVRSDRKVNGMDVTEASLSGTYVAETSPGSGVRVNKPGFTMMAAIIKSGNGDYYAKLVGPSATVEHHAAAFRDFISNVK